MGECLDDRRMSSREKRAVLPVKSNRRVASDSIEEPLELRGCGSHRLRAPRLAEQHGCRFRLDSLRTFREGLASHGRNPLEADDSLAERIRNADAYRVAVRTPELDFAEVAV